MVMQPRRRPKGPTLRKRPATARRTPSAAEEDYLKLPAPHIGHNSLQEHGIDPDEVSVADGHIDLLSERQLEVLLTLGKGQRHSCVVGGARSGKTMLLVRAVVSRALRVRSRHVILRFRSNAVWPSIGMDTFPKVMKLFFPEVRYNENKTLHYFEFENGSQIWLGGLDDKERAERILGNEYSTVYFNECSQIPYASILIGLSRLAEKVEGLEQRAYYDLNPASTRHWTNILFGDKNDPVSNRPVINPDSYAREFMNPADNRSNLSPEYLLSLDTMPERYRKRFRDGLYVDESDDALWTLSTLARCRRFSTEVPSLVRVVVAIDPSGAKNSFDVTHDEIGIMVVGLGDDGHAYVLMDKTLLAGPEEWARTAIAAYHMFRADAVVAEVNFGGAMVEHVIRTIDPAIPFKPVTASRGKVIRAEPVAALYAQDRVHHVQKTEEASLFGMSEEGFAGLEDELCGFTVMGYIGARSPNRADACLIAGTLVSTARGNIPIEEVVVGDAVWTRKGLRLVEAVRQTSPSAKVLEVGTPFGSIEGTPDHLVWEERRGWVRIDALKCGDILTACPDTPALSCIEELSTTEPIVIRISEPSGCVVEALSMSTYGETSMVEYLSRKGTSSITKIMTLSTMLPTIWRPSHARSMGASTAQSLGSRLLRHAANATWPRYNAWLRNGIAVPKDWLGIVSTLLQQALGMPAFVPAFVSSAASRQKVLIGARSDLPAALVAGNGQMRSVDMKSECGVQSAALYSGRISTEPNLRLVRAPVVAISDVQERKAVYDIQVAEQHEFFANGVLVHNCIWAVSELMLAENAAGFVEYYRRMAEGTLPRATPATTPRSIADAIRAGTPAPPAPARGGVPAITGPVETVLLTQPHRNFYLPGSDGRSSHLTSDADGLLRVLDPQHVAHLLNQGCTRPPAETAA